MAPGTLLAAWDAAVAQAQRATAHGKAFLLIDAAQLPADVMPWREYLSHGQMCNVSSDEPEADHPEVCALLVAHDASWTAALLSNYLPRKPFAFTALIADCDIKVLAARLAQCKRVTLDGSRQGLLRIYDAAVLQTLPEALSDANLKKVLACADAWVYLRRDGTMGALPGSGERSGHVSLTHAEQDELDARGTIDRVLAALGKNGRLPVESDPFEPFEKMTLMTRSLFPEGRPQLGPLYRCAALALQVPLDAFRSQWGPQGDFHNLKDQSEGIYDAVLTWAETCLHATEAPR